MQPCSLKTNSICHSIQKRHLFVTCLWPGQVSSNKSQRSPLSLAFLLFHFSWSLTAAKTLEGACCHPLVPCWHLRGTQSTEEEEEGGECGGGRGHKVMEWGRRESRKLLGGNESWSIYSLVKDSREEASAGKLESKIKGVGVYSSLKLYIFPSFLGSQSVPGFLIASALQIDCLLGKALFLKKI